MRDNDSQSSPARKYLDELEKALASTPAALRSEILTDVAGELRGLDEGAANARIAELGDARGIAADVTEARQQEAQPALSKLYPNFTAVILTAGWYFLPLIGWIAGLVMIGAGTHWEPRVRRNSILASVAAALVAIGALMAFRPTEFWPIGLTAFLVVPLLANIFISSHLREKWGAQAA